MSHDRRAAAGRALQVRRGWLAFEPGFGRRDIVLGESLRVVAPDLPGHPLHGRRQVVSVDGSHRRGGDVTPCRLRQWRRLDRRSVRQPFCGRTRLAAPVWRNADTLSARLTDKTPSSRRAGPDRRGPKRPRAGSGVRRAWWGRRSFVRPCGSDGDELTSGTGLHQALRTRRFAASCSARGRSVRQPRAQRVYQAAAVAGTVGVRPQPVAGQSAHRAAANVSTGTESRHHQSVRPVHRSDLAETGQRVGGELGATTRRASPSTTFG